MVSRKLTDKLILDHIPFVDGLVERKYRWFKADKEDLKQAGYLGLCKAAIRFNPDNNIKFSTYAYHWVRSEILETALKEHSIVKIARTKSQRKLFFNRNLLIGEKDYLTMREINDLCDELNVSSNDIKQMEFRLKNGYDISFERVKL